MFYSLSDELVDDHSIVFATALGMVLSGSDSRMRSGDVLKTITQLISEGKTQDGADPAPYEIGRWGYRFMCEDMPSQSVDDDMYYAWVSTDFWDYKPNLVFYTKEKFIYLFVECCRNYVEKRPERREEFAAAMAANGIAF